MAVRPVGGADYRFIFKYLNNAAIDTPRIIEDSYRSIYQVQVPTVFHDKEPGKMEPVKMNFKARLNIIS